MGVDVGKLAVIGGVISVPVGVEHQHRQLGHSSDQGHHIAGLRPGVQQNGPGVPQNQEAPNHFLLNAVHPGADFMD